MTNQPPQDPSRGSSPWNQGGQPGQPGQQGQPGPQGQPGQQGQAGQQGPQPWQPNTQGGPQRSQFEPVPTGESRINQPPSSNQQSGQFGQQPNSYPAQQYPAAPYGNSNQGRADLNNYGAQPYGGQPPYGQPPYGDQYGSGGGRRQGIPWWFWVVLSAILIGLGVGLFFLLSGDDKEDTADPTTTETTSIEVTTDETTSEDPTTEDPTTEDPTTEDPTTEDPTTEDPTTEDPTTEDPTTEDPTDDPTDLGAGPAGSPYWGIADSEIIPPGEAFTANADGTNMDIEVLSVSMDEAPPADFSGDLEGGKLIGATVRITNNGSEVESAFFELAFSWVHGDTYWDEHFQFSDGYLAGAPDLEPGASMETKVLFIVPQGLNDGNVSVNPLYGSAVVPDAIFEQK